MQNDRDLRELVQRLSEAAGPNLAAVVLYGSAADPGTHESRSNSNVLCLLRKTTGAELARLQPVTQWWSRKRHPAPLTFTLQELRDAADIFAIELLDMKQRHIVLFGDDFLTGLDVPMALHRHQVERELRSSVIRLRESYLCSTAHREELNSLMSASASWLAVLFRHSLIALGEAAPHGSREATDHLATKLGLNLQAFHVALDLREGKRNAADLHVAGAFAAYLDAVASVADEMDRRLAAG